MKVTVIGIGHIGLPLAVAIDKNTPYSVYAFDVSEAALSQLETRIANFMEDSLDTALQTHQIRALRAITKSDIYVVTVGTPVNTHFKPDTSAVEDVVWHLFENDFMRGSLLVLRSTVPVGYTDGVVEKASIHHGMSVNKDYFLAYCPERIAEGVALSELKNHPQLVGTSTLYDQSYVLVSGLFSWTELLPMTFKEAEFAKLATNTYRSMHFAIASYLQMAGMKHGVDFIGIRDKMMYEYPRLSHLPRPGFTGGPCLRKDFAMLGRPGDLAFQSYMTNEEYPRWVAETSVKPGSKVLILGAGFKDGSDDIRNSLVEVLYDEVQRITGLPPTVFDPTLEPWRYYTFSSGEKIPMVDRETAEEMDFDVIIFGNPLTDYSFQLSKILTKRALFVDPFGFFTHYQLDNSPL